MKLKENLVYRNKDSVENYGDFVPANKELTAEQIGLKSKKTVLYLEATPEAEMLPDDKRLLTLKIYSCGEEVLDDTVRLNPICMQFVTKGENEEIVPTDFVGVCTPRPQVKLADPDLRISGKNLRLQIRCDEILDPVADNLPRGVADIKEVKVFVNGYEKKTASVRAVDGGAPSFWRQHPYKGKFNPINLSLALDELD